MCMVFFGHFISDIISSQKFCPLCQPMSAFALPPLPTFQAIFSIFLAPPPPFASHCQDFAKNTSPLAADIICEQPLTHSQLLNVIILKFNSQALLNLLGNIFPYCPAVKAIRRTNSSSIDLQERSMLDL